MSSKNYRDLIAWQKSIQLVAAIHGSLRSSAGQVFQFPATSNEQDVKGLAAIEGHRN